VIDEIQKSGRCQITIPDLLTKLNAQACQNEEEQILLSNQHLKAKLTAKLKDKLIFTEQGGRLPTIATFLDEADSLLISNNKKQEVLKS